jgi:hypothetical protein
MDLVTFTVGLSMVQYAFMTSLATLFNGPCLFLAPQSVEIVAAALLRIYQSQLTLATCCFDAPCRLQAGQNVVRDCSWHPYSPVMMTTGWDGKISMFTHVAPDP